MFININPKFSLKQFITSSPHAEMSLEEWSNSIGNIFTNNAQQSGVGLQLTQSNNAPSISISAYQQIQSPLSNELQAINQAADLFNAASELRFNGKNTEAEAEYKKAFIAYRDLALKYNNNSAHSRLAAMYRQGLGVAQDDKRAFAHTKKAVALGDTDLLATLAEDYELGRGVKANPHLAFEYYKKAVDNGDSYSAEKVAHGLHTGTGCTKNLGEAIKYYKQVTDNDGNQYYQIARIYQQGYTGQGENNKIEAVKWFLKYYDIHPKSPNTIESLSQIYKSANAEERNAIMALVNPTNTSNASSMSGEIESRRPALARLLQNLVS